MNPYELFNIKIDYKKDKYFLRDLKKIYHSWALITHPDKGGSASEMKIIQNAYEFIRDDCMSTINFVEYCLKKEKESIPDYVTIYNEVYNLPKIDMSKDFSSDKLIPVCIDHGYGNNSNDFSFNYFENRIIETTDNDHSCKYLNFDDMLKDKLEDYTIHTNSPNINLNDYMHAYMQPSVYGLNPINKLPGNSNLNFVNYEKEVIESYEIPNKSYEDMLKDLEETKKIHDRNVDMRGIEQNIPMSLSRPPPTYETLYNEVKDLCIN
jgi:hypothetical protein